MKQDSKLANRMRDLFGTSICSPSVLFSNKTLELRDLKSKEVPGSSVLQSITGPLLTFHSFLCMSNTEKVKLYTPCKEPTCTTGACSVEGSKGGAGN